jgi:mannose-1-phosphate guanylyltransferase/mannose-6-phosphate isomerase
MDYAVILCGGIGSRFWPLSRKFFPKQFLKIVNDESLLAATIRRARCVIPSENIYLVASKPYLKELKKYLRYFSIPKKNIILEPRPLNTLPAISLCARLISRNDPWANIIVFPSDHYIKGEFRFKQAMRKALSLSTKGFICLFGIKPDKPRLGYGYIQTGNKINNNMYFVRSFLEKPDFKKATAIVKRKDIFWNSGIFCFKAESLLREIKTYLPKLHGQITKINGAQDTDRYWRKIKPISIDYGLLERSRNLAVIIADFFWCDLGSWDSLFNILPKDKKNNVILSGCSYVDLGSKNNLICSTAGSRLIATVGINDLIIADTPDALLICNKGMVQEIKKLVEVLMKKRKACV